MIRVLVVLLSVMAVIPLHAQTAVSAKLNSKVVFEHSSFQYTWTLNKPLDSISPLDFVKGVKVTGYSSSGKKVTLSVLTPTATLMPDWVTVSINVPLMGTPADLASVTIQVPSVKGSDGTDKKQRDVKVAGSGSTLKGSI